jgi:hypothetical protein
MSRAINLRRSIGWALTDIDGRVECVSRDLQRFCGGRRIARGHDFFRLFPDHEKAVRFDVTVALTGWPAGRMIVIDAMSAQPVAVRYLISRRLFASIEGAGLYWQVEFQEIGGDSQD